MARTKRTPDSWYQRMKRQKSQSSATPGQWMAVNTGLGFAHPNLQEAVMADAQRQQSKLADSVPEESEDTEMQEPGEKEPPLRVGEGNTSTSVSGDMVMNTSHPTQNVQGPLQPVKSGVPEALASLRVTFDRMQKMFAPITKNYSQILADTKLSLNFLESTFAQNSAAAGTYGENVANATSAQSPLTLLANAALSHQTSDADSNDDYQASKGSRLLERRAVSTPDNDTARIHSRAPVPETTVPVFRPVVKPFICQRSFLIDGIPCPFQRECESCTAQQKCDQKDCKTRILNNNTKGSCLGPGEDIIVGSDFTAKTSRTSVKHYFGRNKKGSNHIDVTCSLLCRKCYQHLSYIGKGEPQNKWAKLKSEMLHISVDLVEQQQVRQTGHPGVWVIQLKRTEQDRLDDYYRRQRNEEKLERGPAQSKIPPKSNATLRKQTKGTYRAPISVLRHIDDTWCGKNRSVQDCHSLNNWCATKLDDGSLPDLPLWEHIPQWEGDAEFPTKRKGKAARQTRQSEIIESGDETEDEEPQTLLAGESSRKPLGSHQSILHVTPRTRGIGLDTGRLRHTANNDVTFDGIVLVTPPHAETVSSVAMASYEHPLAPSHSGSAASGPRLKLVYREPSSPTEDTHIRKKAKRNLISN